MYRNTASGRGPVTSQRFVIKGFSTGRDIQTTLEKSSSISVSFTLPPGNFTNIPSHFHDCGFSSSKWLRPRPSIQSPLRHDPWTLLPHHPPNVCLRLDTPRTTRSKEAIREEQPLGRIRSILEPNKYFDPISATNI